VNLLKSPLRRTTAVLAGAFIGLAGAVAAAAPASAHHPLVSAESSCVNEDGSWTVTWKVANSEDDITAEAKIAAQPKDKSTLTGVGEDGTATLPKSGEGALTVEQALTAEANWAKLVVRAKWVRGDKVIKQSADGSMKKPTEACKPEQPETPPTEPSTPPAEQAPTPILEFTCDTMTIGIDNTTDEDVTLLLTTSKGEKRTLEVKAGDEGTEKFSATEGFSVTVGAEGTDETEKVDFQKPEDCAGEGAGGPVLPVTGAAAGSIAGGAALLLAVGGVLFFLARRRKVKFTA
jgi:LPXTG-motif cell wall-anchored protein